MRVAGPVLVVKLFAEIVLTFKKRADERGVSSTGCRSVVWKSQSSSAGRPHMAVIEAPGSKTSRCAMKGAAVSTTRAVTTRLAPNRNVLLCFRGVNSGRRAAIRSRARRRERDSDEAEIDPAVRRTFRPQHQHATSLGAGEAQTGRPTRPYSARHRSRA